MRPEPDRPDPDMLIALTGDRGRLKIFLGAAPGVGKTWEMLNQAHRRRDAGDDVLAGIIETHRRAETEAQLRDMPVLPQRDIAYRGQTLREFDLDAALDRRPGLLLVDELAHTNVPGSRHAKRWEDVAALIAAGIPVWATLNIQHLESLNDDVARITGIRVTETLPDRVLEMADEIELIDVPPAALQDRMRAGHIYPAENARRALNGFFKSGNLAALREIALRRAAQHVDGDVRDWMRRTGVAGPWPVRDGLLALIGPDRSSEAVVRHAKRLAEALRAPWTALHVERGASLDAARPALALAAALGAEVETTAAVDLVGAVIAAAQAGNATHLVIGRAAMPLWRRVLRRLIRPTLGAQLLRRAPEYALHIIPLLDPGKPATRRIVPVPLSDAVAAGGIIAAITGFGAALRFAIPGEAMGMIYVAGVVLVATFWDLRAALGAALLAFLAWDFFFLPPLYKITIGSPRDIVAAIVFAAVAALTGSLASRVRVQARAAQTRVDGLRRIAAFSRKLGEPTTEPDLLAEVARQAAALAHRAVLLDVSGDDMRIRAAEPDADTLDEGAWAAARWTWARDEPTGRGTTTLPATPWRFLPLRTARGRLGVLGVRWERSPDQPQIQAATALADQAAIAWERVRLAGEQARIDAFAETGKLRTALLASLGHDLRTPLAGIRGAAGTLRDAWDRLAAETRVDLLHAIDQDVGRMARFLHNITELTRLESGQIKPRLAQVRLAPIVDAAIARLADAPIVATDLSEPDIVVHVDPNLLEQVLVNILENAVRYAPTGSLTRLAARQSGSDAAITIADEGGGIPAEDQPHVFDSFYRAQRGDRTTPGTGLGLAIAKGLIEAIGGRIGLTSPRLDRPADGLPGTVVTLHVPLALPRAS